jgi:hypothetical protein
MTLSERYYKYLLLPIFILKTKNHIRTIPHNKYLHFGGESEILMFYHIKKEINKLDYFFKDKFWIIRRK